MSDASSSNVGNLATEGSNLYGVIDRHNVHGLNLAVPENARAIIKPWNEREDTEVFVDSGIDDQLVIHVPFNQSVRVRSLLLKTGRGEVSPRNLKIYINHPNIVDFADAESFVPQLNITLQEGSTTVTEYPLRTAVFANVSSMSLHFREAVGEEVSRIYYIGFKGDAPQQQKDSSSELEVRAENTGSTPLSQRQNVKVGAQQGTAR